MRIPTGMVNGYIFLSSQNLGLSTDAPREFVEDMPALLFSRSVDLLDSVVADTVKSRKVCRTFFRRV
jgi:hypothetical protein